MTGFFSNVKNAVLNAAANAAYFAKKHPFEAGVVTLAALLALAEAAKTPEGSIDGFCFLFQTHKLACAMRNIPACEFVRDLAAEKGPQWVADCAREFASNVQMNFNC